MRIDLLTLFPDQCRAALEGGVVGRRDLWLPMVEGWRERLIDVLESLGRLTIDGPDASGYTLAAGD